MHTALDATMNNIKIFFSVGRLMKQSTVLGQGSSEHLDSLAEKHRGDFSLHRTLLLLYETLLVNINTWEGHIHGICGTECREKMCQIQLWRLNSTGTSTKGPLSSCQGLHINESHGSAPHASYPFLDGTLHEPPPSETGRWQRSAAVPTGECGRWGRCGHSRHWYSQAANSYSGVINYEVVSFSRMTKGVEFKPERLKSAIFYSS